MESSKQKSLTPWIIAGCGILVLFACIVTTVFGAGGFLIANQALKRNAPAKHQFTVSMAPQTAVLQNLQGWVEVKSLQGDWTPAALDQTITAGQNVRTGKLSSATIVFNDGSQASLLANSELVIDELNAEKDGKQRIIVMTQVSGESTHQVIPNKRSDSRYEVLTPSGAGLAKGTEFHVVVTPEQTAYYYVLEGVVAVSGMETTVLVNPGFMTIIYASQPPLVPVQSISVEGLVSQIGSQWTIAGSTFNADDKTVILGNPQIGDWVIAKGHVDESNQNIADSIILVRSALTNQYSLAGKVEAIGDNEWKINGQTISITDKTAIDEGIQVGDTVRVAGMIEAGGLLQASKIERIDAIEGMPFEFIGMLQKMEGSTWTISGTPVSTNDKTTLTEGLKAGDQVAVKGWIQADNTWLAKSITLAAEEHSEFAFTGKLESINPWKAAGIAFETRDFTAIQADLKAGDLVRVEGEIDANGVWIAAKIEKVDLENPGKMVILGTVMSINPWIVNGISLKLATDAVVSTDVKVGMLAWVELVLQPDGTWLVMKIEPLATQVWFPGCMDVIATVVSTSGSQLQLLNWPLMTVENEAKIEGTLTPNSIVRIRMCFDQQMVIKITYIIIVEPGDINGEPPVGEDGDGGKVTVCHKPDSKKGGHTLSIGRSALGAHLGHGDYQGACR